MRTIEDELFLFDDVEDPYQLNNLADKADTADVQGQLELELSRQLDKIGDPFREKEFYLNRWGYEVGDDAAVPYSD